MRALLVSVMVAGLVVGCAIEAPAPRGTAPLYNQWPFDAKEARRRQKETARALGVPVEKTVDLGGGVKLELVLIPAGEFMMGGEDSPEEVARKSGGIEVQLGWSRNEQPQHKVRITKPFYMAKHEVTQEQWERLIDKNPSERKGAKNPVDAVSWDDCQKFVKRLNGLGKKTTTWRLPTEAEWEYACRAGTATAFHTGGTLSTDEANYDGRRTYGDGKKGEYRATTTAVGTFKPNAFGLYDMHGNVLEWCTDRYKKDYYKHSPKDDPSGPATGEFRVLRGGSDFLDPAYCRSAYRYYNEPDLGNCNFGFRVVAVVR